MNLVVKKYGGTSVASIAKISKIAENLVDEYNSNKKIVVVCQQWVILLINWSI